MKNITTFKMAMDACNIGDYEVALRTLRILAEQGEVEAQFNLGLMYE